MHLDISGISQIDYQQSSHIFADKTRQRLRAKVACFHMN